MGAEFRDDKGGSPGAFILYLSQCSRNRNHWPGQRVATLSIRYSVWEPEQNEA